MKLTTQTTKHLAPDTIVDAFKAVGHPSRMAILLQLAERERCCGADFCHCLDLAQSTISQHLEMLRQAGLVEWQQRGTRSLYTLNRTRLNELADALGLMAKTNCCSAAGKDE